MTFGHTARDTRLQLGLTQEAVAERVGISQAALSQIETGARTTTIRTARAVCDALGLPRRLVALAFQEAYAVKYAAEFGLTYAEAVHELARDHERALAEFEATGKATGPARVVDLPDHPLRYCLSATNPNAETAAE